jgi:capsule polysaccharide export protein KpsE/RkpR
MVASAAQLQGELIATQSQMQGLQQIYTPNNVRVRALAARIAELRRQLNKMSGTGALSGSGDHSDNELYPSIRKLPLLGVEWADLYRETKVQETVYELLTQKYELARIEEAKEVPIVKVADRANVPEKKSFPPRLLLIMLSATAAFCAGWVWLAYREQWERVDSSDPRKLLLLDIVRESKGGMNRLKSGLNHANGNGWHPAHSSSSPRNGNAPE